MSDREAGNQIVKGNRRYRNWIHSESKKSESHKNHTFKFGKPTKASKANKQAQCPRCDKTAALSEHTKAVICGCGELYKVDFSKKEE